MKKKHFASNSNQPAKTKDVCWVSPTCPRTQVHRQSNGPVQNGQSRTKTSDFHNFGWRNGTFESFCSCWYKMDPLPVISPFITGTGPLCFNDTYINQKQSGWTFQTLSYLSVSSALHGDQFFLLASNPT